VRDVPAIDTDMSRIDSSGAVITTKTSSMNEGRSVLHGCVASAGKSQHGAARVAGWVSEYCTGAYKYLAATELPTSTLSVMGTEGGREEKSEARQAGK